MDVEEPDLPGPEDALLVEWAAELALRIRNGDAIDWDELTNQNPQRAQELRKLLPAFDLMAPLSHSSKLAATGHESLPEIAGELGCLGDFRLIREVGRGGMGIVYEAQQISLGRRVALKILPQGLALDRKRLRRFQLEAQATALLYHPHIVPVHMIGSERGVQFFAMQFIDGRTLADLIHELRWRGGHGDEQPGADHFASELATQLLAEQAAPVPHEHGVTSSVEEDRPTQGTSYFRRVTELGRQAAAALEHAHQQGVIHRDVKPGNLMIDRAGHLWITDFGLARLLNDPGVTMTNDLLGTTRYMSPEQVKGHPDIVDQRSDVYSLGATLYELLVLWPAFPGTDRTEVLRQILEEDPVPLRRLDRSIPMDLETIVQKAMDKDPARRYATAGAMAEDLRRSLEHLPILARRPTIRDRAVKWSRRHRYAVVLAAAFLILALAGLIGDLTWSNRWLRSHNDRLGQALAQADENAREAQRQRTIAQTQLDLARRHQNAETLRRARQALDARQVELAQEILHDDWPAAGQRDRREFAWRYLWRQSRRDYRLLWGHLGHMWGNELSPDGRVLASFDVSGKAVIYDFPVGVELARPRLELTLRYGALSTSLFSPDGRSLALGNLGVEGPSRGIEVFDCQIGRCIVHRTLSSGDSAHSMAFGQHGRRFALIIKRIGEHFLSSFDLNSAPADEQIRSLGQDVVFSLLSPDASKLCLQSNGRIELADAVTGQALRHLAGRWQEPASRGGFSPDGRFLTVAIGSELLVWELGGGRIIARVPTIGRSVGTVWSPRGRYLAWGEDNGRVAIVETGSGTVRELIPRSPTFKVLGFSPAFSADETLLVYSQRRIPGGPTPPRVWNVQDGQLIAEFPDRNQERSATFLPGGHDLLLGGSSRFGIWTVHALPLPDRLAGHRAEAWAAAFSADGKVLATASDDTGEQQTIRLWDPFSGKQLAGWKGHRSMVSALAFSPDGRILVSGSLDSAKKGPPNLLLWDASTYRPLAALPGHPGGVRTVVFSPDGRRLAAAGDDGTVRIWDPSTRTLQATLTGHTAKVVSLAFSPDGAMLASGSNDSTARLWNPSSGQAVAILQDLREVFAVRFAPDGSILASVNELGELKLWNPSTGRLLRTIPGDSQELRVLSFTADSRAVAAAGKSKVIHFWDVVTGQEILTLEGHKAQINALVFSPDDSILASCSHDGAVRLWSSGAIDPRSSR